MSAHRIGTVTLLQTRIYPRNSKADVNDLSEESVVVEPGDYDLYEDFTTWERFWVMNGRINVGNQFRSHGDGLYTFAPGDRRGDKEVTVLSQTFDPDAWAELRSLPICQEGPEQRLVITIGSQSS